MVTKLPCVIFSCPWFLPSLALYKVWLQIRGVLHRSKNTMCARYCVNIPDGGLGGAMLFVAVWQPMRCLLITRLSM